MQFNKMARACATAALSLLSIGIAAAPLRLDEAIVRALEHNPELAVFAHELAANDARLRQATLRPPFELAVAVENAFGQADRRGFDAAETTLSLGFVLEHGVARQRRIVAAADRDAYDAQRLVRQTEIAAETAQRFITILEQQRHKAEFVAAIELARRELKRVAGSGAVSLAEARAHAQLARATLDASRADRELSIARRQLAMLWGRTEPDFVAIEGNLEALPALQTFESLRAEIANNTEFRGFAAEQRLRESELRLAEAGRRAPWEVSAGVRRFEDADDYALLFEVAVPIGTRRHVDAGIAAARAQAAAADAKRTAARIDVDAKLFETYQALTQSYREAQLLRDDVLPPMERAVEALRGDELERFAAQGELLELRRTLSTAYADAHRARVEIERLTGVSLQSAR